LELEGLARDLLRFVQEARKSNGLEVTDRIIITFYSNSTLLQESLNLWGNFIKEGALALEIVVQPWSDQSPGEPLNLDMNTTLVIQKAS
jgi:isoleucyl-tRNA synthetase